MSEQQEISWQVFQLMFSIFISLKFRIWSLDAVSGAVEDLKGKLFLVMLAAAECSII